MLMNSENRKECGFSDLLLSYVFDEANLSERAEFESHLSGCLACTAELGEMSAARGFVTDYKKAAFDPLITPLISIDYDPSIDVLPEEISLPWYERLAELFTSSRSWAMTSAAFAALLLTLGMVYLAVNSGSSNDRAANSLPINSPVPSPTEVAKSAPSSATNTSSAAEPKDSKAPAMPEPDNGVVKISGKVKPAAGDRKTITAVEQRQKPTRSTQENKKKATNSTKVPDLDSSDDDEESLRLVDLLDEITISDTQ